MASSTQNSKPLIFCFEVELQFLPNDSQWFIVLPRPVWCSLANLKSSQPFRSAFLMLKVFHLIKVLGFCLNRCEHYLVVRLILVNKMVHVVPWLGNVIVIYPIYLLYESIYRQTKAVSMLTGAKLLKITDWKMLRNMKSWIQIRLCILFLFSTGMICSVDFSNSEHLGYSGWKEFIYICIHTISILCVEFFILYASWLWVLYTSFYYIFLLI